MGYFAGYALQSPQSNAGELGVSAERARTLPWSEPEAPSPSCTGSTGGTARDSPGQPLCSVPGGSLGAAAGAARPCRDAGDAGDAEDAGDAGAGPSPSQARLLAPPPPAPAAGSAPCPQPCSSPLRALFSLSSLLIWERILRMTCSRCVFPSMALPGAALGTACLKSPGQRAGPGPGPGRAGQGCPAAKSGPCFIHAGARVSGQSWAVPSAQITAPGQTRPALASLCSAEKDRAPFLWFAPKCR